MSPGAVYSYFREIAVNTPIDVTLYNIPMFANPVDVPTVQRLAELPRIIGIKDSSGDVAFMLRMMAAIEPTRPEFVFLTGWEPALVPMLSMGCQGATIAMSGVVPEVTGRLFELVRNSQLTDAHALQFNLTQLFDLTVLGAGFPEGVRAALGLRGFDFGLSRQPLDECRHLDLAPIKRLIRQMLQLVRSRSTMRGL